MNQITQICIAIAYFTALASIVSCAPEQAPIDPSVEVVKLTVGGKDLDIPLGFFFHKTIWSNGRWPKPNPVRTPADSVRIYAYIDGIKPWSKENNGAFTGLASQEITMIVIDGRYPTATWLNNFLAPRLPTFRSVKTHDSAEGMLAFESDYSRNETIFLERLPPEKPFTKIICGNAPGNGCEVTFDYKDNLVVRYSLPRGLMYRWKSIHAQMSRFLDTL